MTPRETLSAYLRELPPAALARIVAQPVGRWTRRTTCEFDGRRCLVGVVHDAFRTGAGRLAYRDPMRDGVAGQSGIASEAFDALSAAGRLPALVASLQAEARTLLETTP